MEPIVAPAIVPALACEEPDEGAAGEVGAVFAPPDEAGGAGLH